MARAKSAARLHLLTVKQVQNVPEGDHSDGGGLLLRIRGGSCSWVFRFTAPSGRRREMGLGVAHLGSPAQAGESVTAARRQAHEAREQLQALQNIEPHERARNFKGGRPQETMQRIRQRLDAVFEDAVFHKRCSSNPAAAIRRKMREAMPRKQAGEFAALPYREAPAFMARLRQAEATS